MIQQLQHKQQHSKCQACSKLHKMQACLQEDLLHLQSKDKLKVVSDEAWIVIPTQIKGSYLHLTVYLQLTACCNRRESCKVIVTIVLIKPRFCTHPSGMVDWLLPQDQ